MHWLCKKMTMSSEPRGVWKMQTGACRLGIMVRTMSADRSQRWTLVSLVKIGIKFPRPPQKEQQSRAPALAEFPSPLCNVSNIIAPQVTGLVYVNSCYDGQGSLDPNKPLTDS